jgi:hypothetical protein
MLRQFLNIVVLYINGDRQDKRDATLVGYQRDFD